MSQSKSSSPPLVAITVIGMAVIFALSLFLGGMYLRNRLNIQSPPGNTSIQNDVSINGQVVTFVTYTDEEVILLPEGENTVSGGDSGAVTAVPILPTLIPSTPADGTAIPPTAVPPAPVLPTVLPSTTTSPISKIAFSSYTVQAGDTLYGIAYDFHWLTTIALMAKYNIASGDIIVGNTLRIPVGNAAYCPGNRPYVISDGENADSIAAMVGTTANTIKQINKLGDSYTLYVTDVICVP